MVLFLTSAPIGSLILLVAFYVCVVLVTLIQEQLQSGITMASVNQIDSIFFCDSVCVSSTWVTTCHVPHVHVLFYEGTCPKK